MKAQEFIDFYFSEVNKISEKFEQIHKECQKWMVFNGRDFVNADYSDYRVLKCYKDSCNDYKIVPLDYDDKIEISWTDLDNRDCKVNVTNEFFDDFEKFLEGVRAEVNKHNSEEADRHKEFQIKLEEKKKIEEQKQYKEFLRLKQIYEPTKSV